MAYGNLKAEMGRKNITIEEIAKEIGIDVHNTPDSQEICFVKDNDYAGYVTKHSTTRIEEGYFVDTHGNPDRIRRGEVMEMARPRGTDSARVIQVIVTEALRGKGTNEDLCRLVTQYWDFEGNLLAENDPCITESVTQGDV